MKSSKAGPQVELGRATVRDFMAVFRPPEGKDRGISFFEFCDKVVVGGIMDLSMDELPTIMGEVETQIRRCSEEIKEAINMAHLLGDVDKHLEVGEE